MLSLSPHFLPNAWTTPASTPSAQVGNCVPGRRFGEARNVWKIPTPTTHNPIATSESSLPHLLTSTSTLTASTPAMCADKAMTIQPADTFDEDFDRVDAGASTTYPIRAGELKKGSHVVIAGHPCKVRHAVGIGNKHAGRCLCPWAVVFSHASCCCQ